MKQEAGVVIHNGKPPTLNSVHVSQVLVKQGAYAAKRCKSDMVVVAAAVAMHADAALSPCVVSLGILMHYPAQNAAT